MYLLVSPMYLLFCGKPNHSINGNLFFVKSGRRLLFDSLIIECHVLLMGFHAVLTIQIDSLIIKGDFLEWFYLAKTQIKKDTDTLTLIFKTIFWFLNNFVVLRFVTFIGWPIIPLILEPKWIRPPLMSFEPLCRLKNAISKVRCFYVSPMQDPMLS